MRKSRSTPPTHKEITNAMYDADGLVEYAKTTIAEMTLLNDLHGVTSKLSDDTCAWDEEKEDWTRSSKLFLDAWNRETPEGFNLVQLDYIYVFDVSPMWTSSLIY